ncbi:MAG TPA: hypothetical protein VEQ15_10600 [Myxococcales bacterium]|nr:hypothetical protein [Myxococcales bacterium]
MRSVSQVCLAAMLLASAAVPAQENQPYQPQPRTGYDSTYQKHFGFYLRPDLGFGYMSSTESGITISGFSGLGGVAIGGAIRENSILAVHIIDAVAQNPSVSSGGSSSSTTDTSLLLWGIGPQYTHYFMPANVYLSTTLALTRLHISSGGRSEDSNWGVGTRIALGKEWWVSDHWGLGVAGHISFSSNQDPVASNNTLTTWAFGAAFSATYN